MDLLANQVEMHYCFQEKKINIGEVFWTINDKPGIGEIRLLKKDNNELSTTIKTNRLFIRSIQNTLADQDHYFSLVGNPRVREKVGDGKVKTREVSDDLVKRFAADWFNNNPYSALLVFEKDNYEVSNERLIGCVILYPLDAGEVDLVYYFNEASWGKRYGTEAVTAVAKGLLPDLIKYGYQVKGAIPTKLIATAREDNEGSWRILERLGLQLVKRDIKNVFGDDIRRYYSMDVAELQK